MVEALSMYKDTAYLWRREAKTLPTSEIGVMIMASDRLFKIQHGSCVGNILWIHVRDKRRAGTTQDTLGGSDIHTVYRCDSVDTVIEKLLMTYREGGHGIEGREICRPPQYTAFTPQEQRVIRLISCGLAPKAIARALAIHPKTVSAHKCSVMRKLGLNRTQDLHRWLQLSDLVNDMIKPWSVAGGAGR
ncbi:helix-turn-helix domain-containing protein [Serratia ureilytica]|uniref:helix-turn-helix domain-containing protein n=1 Tax=Serratia ureilytica TaxID=300181 RepID=UPI003BAEDE8F